MFVTFWQKDERKTKWISSIRLYGGANPVDSITPTTTNSEEFLVPVKSSQSTEPTRFEICPALDDVSTIETSSGGSYISSAEEEQNDFYLSKMLKETF